MSKVGLVASRETWCSHGYRITVYRPKDEGIHDKLVIKPENEWEERPSIEFDPKTGQAHLEMNCEFANKDIPKMQEYLTEAEKLIAELKLNKELVKLDLL